MKVLQIIESGYRGTLEEQDDTILWLTHCLRTAGAELSVLLKDNAVNYAILGQDAGGLAFGAWTQTQPPQIAATVAALIARQVDVFVVSEDLETRGLRDAERVGGVRAIARAELPRLADQHDHVWHW
jgi:sulfur transfer complex TusBCD TusB component (DsrH family)